MMKEQPDRRFFEADTCVIRLFKCSRRCKTISKDNLINEEIRAREVRLIASDGTQLGVVSIEEAMEKANEAKLDLVNISPNAKPPVCKLLDYGKYRYEQQKKEKEAKKKQKSYQVKEVRLGIFTEEHDLTVKANNAIKFLKSGDIVNVDVSTIYKGYFADASRMFMIGEVSPDMQRLVQVTKECRDIGIQTAQPWARLGDVGAAIQEHAEKNGYSVVRDLCGHGCGVKFHEEPDVEHFGKRGTGMLIVPGMTFTIEPMINMGSYEVFIDEADGWTVCTDDGLPSAQWESQILITEDGNEILTQ